MALWPVMGMLDRISEHAVTICMLGSYRWSYNASKSYSHTHTLVHTDQGNLWLGQPILCSRDLSPLLPRGSFRRGRSTARMFGAATPNPFGATPATPAAGGFGAPAAPAAV